MFFGFTLPTQVHAAISLLALAAGFIVIVGLIQSMRLPAITAVFLLATTLTSAHGFLLPSSGLTPARIFGILTLVAMVPTLYGLYGAKLAGKWRAGYVIGAVFVQYLNFFVLIVRLFRAVPTLAAAAPTQSEPPFALAQGIVLIAFVAIGILAVKRFHPQGAPYEAHARIAHGGKKDQIVR